MDEREYSLLEHLNELRQRIMRAALGVLPISLATFAVSTDILEILKQPMLQAMREFPNAKAEFVVIKPMEYIIAQLKAAVVTAIFLAMPWILYQLWLFIAPGLYAKEKRYVLGFVWAGSLFFIAGGVFAYFLVFPGIFRFDIEQTLAANVAQTYSVAEHFSMTLKLLLAFGLAFEAPVIVFILAVAGIVNPATLGRYRSYVFVAAFVVGAILTPPDILSQVLLATPLVILFELGLWAARVALWFRERGQPKGGQPNGDVEPTGLSTESSSTTAAASSAPAHDEGSPASND